MTPATIRIAAVADVHCSKTNQGSLQPIFAAASEMADVLLLCGDLTDYGYPEEARNLRGRAGAGDDPDPRRAGQPRLRVGQRGGGEEDPDRRARPRAGRRCGRGPRGRVRGGQGIRRRLRPAHPRAVGRGRDQGLRARGGVRGAEAGVGAGAAAARPSASRCCTTRPSRPRWKASPARSIPFLGSGRLEEPLNRYRVAAAFHGHAHRGAPEGRTSAGIPVYNVALPVLRRTLSEQLPLKIVEVSVPEPVGISESAPSRRRDDPQ